MSRKLDEENELAVEQDVVRPVLFAHLDFPSGDVRVHSAIGTIQWGGHDWLGVGTLGEISGLTESAELERKTVTYKVRGVPNDLIATALNENYQGRSDKVYIAFFDAQTYQMVAPPHLLHAGMMDVISASIGATASLAITSESRIAGWKRPVVRRYTDAEQQRRYPGDRGLEFVSQSAQKEIVWGRKA